MRLTLSAQLADSQDGRRVTARSQSRLFDTLDHLADAMQTAAVDRRLLAPLRGDVTDIRELARTWEPVVCRNGEVRNDDDDLSACCK